jgi:predicted ATPase
LFVEELARMLLDRGDLKREGERWQFARERVELDVPNTLQGVLMARIDQLPAESRRILQLASVLGREFPLEVLEEMLTQLERAAQ